MMALLDVAGYAPEACADTAQALSSLRRRRYDLVLTDYSLPCQTGGAFLRQARLEGLLGETPALVITAHPDPAEAAGYEIVTKPFDVDDLMALIGARLGRAAADADV
jgi:CheY-like chemotaxis protein